MRNALTPPHSWSFHLGPFREPSLDGAGAGAEYAAPERADAPSAVTPSTPGATPPSASTDSPPPVVVDDPMLAPMPPPQHVITTWEDAARMLRLLSGRSHLVISGVCVMKDGELADPTEVETSVVEFADLSSAEIAWYVSSGESIDKAGGYGIQGLASRFVTRIAGSYTNVVGLPIALVYRMCTKAGLLLS